MKSYPLKERAGCAHARVSSGLILACRCSVAKGEKMDGLIWAATLSCARSNQPYASGSRPSGWTARKQYPLSGAPGAHHHRLLKGNTLNKRCFGLEWCSFLSVAGCAASAKGERVGVELSLSDNLYSVKTGLHLSVGVLPRPCEGHLTHH